MKKSSDNANPNPIPANIEDGANCSTLALSISNALLYRKCSTIGVRIAKSVGEESGGEWVGMGRKGVEGSRKQPYE